MTNPWIHGRICGCASCMTAEATRLRKRVEVLERVLHGILLDSRVREVVDEITLLESIEKRAMAALAQPAAPAPVDPVAAYERHLAVEKGRVQVWGERVAEPAPCAKCEGTGSYPPGMTHEAFCPRCSGTGYLPGEIVRDVTGREGALRCPECGRDPTGET